MSIGLIAARRRRCARWLRLAVVMALVMSAVGCLSPSPSPQDAPPAHPRLVLGHYFPPFPLSFDNLPPAVDYYAENYLKPDGENGKHSASGGFLRDRPLGRSPLASADWRLEDMRTEVRRAKAAGLDGFIVDILTTQGDNWSRVLTLVNAAEMEGNFVVVPAIDATSGVVSADPRNVAAKLAPLLRSSAAADWEGGPLVSSFAAEGASLGWWRTLLTTLRSSVPRVRFLAVLLDASQDNLRRFSTVAAGLGSWGARTREEVLAAPDLAAAAHHLGKFWMAPVAYQDARHSSGNFAEAGNTSTGRAAWERAIDDGADMVQVVTWNDFAESTAIAPSQRSGAALSELNALYAGWFHAGRTTPVRRELVFLTNRTQPAKATAPGILMKSDLGGASTPPTDLVECLTVLRTPAHVEIQVGSQRYRFDVPAGVHAVTAPLGAGRVSAEVSRAGKAVATVVSPVDVDYSPPRQDLTYVASVAELDSTSGAP